MKAAYLNTICTQTFTCRNIKLFIRYQSRFYAKIDTGIP